MSRRIIPAFLAALAIWAPWAGGRARAAGEPPLLVDGDALVRHWARPVPPAGMTPGSQTVVVRFIVDPSGHVSSARALQPNDAAWDAAAVAAVKGWVFSPALESGKPVAECLDVEVAFTRPGRHGRKANLLPPYPPQPVPLTPPESKYAPDGEYPAVLTRRMIPGRVVFSARVDLDGRVEAPQIQQTSHVDFVLPALDALAHWKFKPGHRGDIPVVAEVNGAVDFYRLDGDRSAVLAANGITAPDGSPPPDPPAPDFVADPVWPYDLLMAGTEGRAAVEFTVDELGVVTAVKVREASQPEFGQALAAAVATWHFQAAIRDGHSVAAPLRIRTEFKASDSALVADARAGKIPTARGLDAPLTPILRIAPAYPADLADRSAGHAVIEFVIARDGRARLPRVVSASRPEFGWAAATALAQWVFQPPRRHGAPVDVRVQIPFNFAPPDA